MREHTHTFTHRPHPNTHIYIYKQLPTNTLSHSHFEDQRLPLLVHWTLWDALLCSPCLGPRLQTFSEKGRETIKLLLMGMGVPLEPAKGSWSAWAIGDIRNAQLHCWC